MKSPTIVHEWFYPGGPETLEYILPIKEFLDGHDRDLPEWTRGFASLSIPEAKRSFDKYLRSIAIPEISALIRIVENLSPYSIVLKETESWLLCKRGGKFDEASAHGNMLLLPAPHTQVEWPALWEGAQFASLKHFLTFFGGTRVDMPPTSGVVAPSEMQPASEEPETGAWRNIGAWDGSYPVYHVGSGDVVLVNADGRFGTWCHELGNDPSGAVKELGSLEQFVAFVASETGIFN